MMASTISHFALVLCLALMVGSQLAEERVKAELLDSDTVEVQQVDNEKIEVEQLDVDQVDAQPLDNEDAAIKPQALCEYRCLIGEM